MKCLFPNQHDLTKQKKKFTRFFAEQNHLSKFDTEELICKHLIEYVIRSVGQNHFKHCLWMPNRKKGAYYSSTEGDLTM